MHSPQARGQEQARCKQTLLPALLPEILACPTLPVAVGLGPWVILLLLVVASIMKHGDRSVVHRW